MCFVQGRLIALPIKRKYFSLPLFGVYLIFFVFFNNFGKRIKECYVTKEKQVSQTYQFQVHGTQGKGTYVRKGHSGKILQGPKVSRRSGKVLQGLCIRHASDGLVESNMDPTLGQRMQMRLIRHNDNILQCNFNEPREGKLDGFSFLESLKKRKRRLHQGTFFEKQSSQFKKRGKLAPKRRLFKTILMSVIKTISLGNLFNFKESEKRLTMDSIFF